MSKGPATPLAEIRGLPDPVERAGAAAERMRELEAEIEALRTIRDDAMTLVLVPPFGAGTIKLAEGARVIGCTRGFMAPYFEPTAVARRKQKAADAARAAV